MTNCLISYAKKVGDEMDREKVINGLEDIQKHLDTGYSFAICWESELIRDAIALLKEQDEEHRRLLSWLGKFCRHIDNGDAWLTDEENIAFFKEKMKQQFGWDTD